MGKIEKDQDISMVRMINNQDERPFLHSIPWIGKYAPLPLVVNLLLLQVMKDNHKEVSCL